MTDLAATLRRPRFSRNWHTSLKVLDALDALLSLDRDAQRAALRDLCATAAAQPRDVDAAVVRVKQWHAARQVFCRAVGGQGRRVAGGDSWMRAGAHHRRQALDAAAFTGSDTTPIAGELGECWDFSASLIARTCTAVARGRADVGLVDVAGTDLALRAHQALDPEVRFGDGWLEVLEALSTVIGDPASAAVLDTLLDERDGPLAGGDACQLVEVAAAATTR